MPSITFGPTFLSDDEITIIVEPGTSVLDAAFEAGVPMGDACGGNCGCSTCHVHVVEGYESLEEMEDDEDDALGKADDVRHISRLGCQVQIEECPLRINVTRESQLAFINEHPEHRASISKVK